MANGTKGTDCRVMEDHFQTLCELGAAEFVTMLREKRSPKGVFKANGNRTPKAKAYSCKQQNTDSKDTNDPFHLKRHTKMICLFCYDSIKYHPLTVTQSKKEKI